MPNVAWIGQIIFLGSYFIAWVVGAFDTLTATSSAHTWIVISAISALVTAIALLLFNGYGYVNRTPAA